MPSQSRRAYLRALALGGASALAGCPGNGATDSDTPASDGEGTPPDSTTTNEPTPTATATRNETPTETPTETATDEPTTTATPEPRLGGAVTPRSDADWPLPDRSAANDAYAADGAVSGESPSVAWRTGARRPDGVSDNYDPVFGPPVVADGRVYIANGLTYGPQLSLPHRQQFRAFDAATGEELWTHEISDETDGVPEPEDAVVGEDAILVAAGQRLRVLDPATGEARRTQTFPDGIETVTPAGDRTYVVADDTVHALGPDGDTEWTTTATVHVGARPALGTDHLYVGGSSKQLYALDPATGDVRWNRTVEHHSGDGPLAVYDVVAVGGGVLVRRANETVYAYDDAGEQVWYSTGGYRSLATDGSRVYCGRETGAVRALDVATGDRRWEREYGLDGGVERPIVAGDRLSLTDGESLVAARSDNGTEDWRTRADAGNLVAGSDGLVGVGYSAERDRFELVAWR